MAQQTSSLTGFVLAGLFVGVGKGGGEWVEVVFLPSAQPQFLCNQVHHWVCPHSSPPLISLHSDHAGASQTAAWRKLRRKTADDRDWLIQKE